MHVALARSEEEVAHFLFKVPEYLWRMDRQQGRVASASEGPAYQWATREVRRTKGDSAERLLALALEGADGVGEGLAQEMAVHFGSVRGMVRALEACGSEEAAVGMLREIRAPGALRATSSSTLANLYRWVLGTWGAEKEEEEEGEEEEDPEWSRPL